MLISTNVIELNKLKYLIESHFNAHIELMVHYVLYNNEEMQIRMQKFTCNIHLHSLRLLKIS